MLPLCNLRSSSGLLTAERGPLQILADAAYAAAELRAVLTAAGHRLLIKPPALKPAVIGGFMLDDFVIDTTAARSPALPGIPSRWPRPGAVASSAAPP
ncbi:hypothetical protein [Nonomuraea composti]|uniref:hypothetical protein n=1 Tax=Nonomuraea composti TaxID=2720023 RepID=UPI001F0D6520|nr:hypothetical protein [Nonomuraea sp. FMUSA5-5]